MKLAALLLVTSAAAHAQLPWTNSTLPNGARLVIVEKRGLPIVRVTITFTGGTHQFEPRDKLGVANFAAAMLLDGAQTSSEANIGGESGTISVATFSDKLQPTLERLADALRRPTFSSDALERLRARRLVQMKQASDDPASLAEGVLNKLLYGDRHPYGMRANEESIRAVTPDDVASFASDYFTPRSEERL